MRPKDPSKQAITVRLDAALVERLRTFCRDQAGKPLYATVNGVVAEAVARELDRLDGELGADPPVPARRRLGLEGTERSRPSLNNR